jgi:chitinase
MNRSIAYYESWASHRACDIYMPSDIDPTPYTHINFAFALIDKDTSKVALSLQNDTILYDQMKKLRTASNHLQIWIAVGGYAVGAAPFSKLAANSTGRGAFVDSVCSFMDKYGFDGMDLDWEYPGATDMGGAQSDGANLVLLLKEYRAKCKNKGLSVTVPGGICEFSIGNSINLEVDMSCLTSWAVYMTGFNLQGIEPYVDWLNVMTYDLHGSWEKPILAQPHTNLSGKNHHHHYDSCLGVTDIFSGRETDITQSLKKVWDAKINPQKVTMGLAYYGKTYTLSSGSCAKPGCAAKGPGNASACSNEAGSLYNSEIEELLSKDSSIKPVLDKNAAVKYFTWNKDQW